MTGEDKKYASKKTVWNISVLSLHHPHIHLPEYRVYHCFKSAIPKDMSRLTAFLGALLPRSML